MSLGGGGGEIPKGGRAGRARSLGIWPRGGEIPRDLAPGGEITGGRNPWDTGIDGLGSIEHALNCLTSLVLGLQTFS